VGSQEPELVPRVVKLINPVIRLEAIEGVDGIVLMTSWKEFQQVPELLKKVNPYAVLVDGRRMLNKRLMPHYEGIGL
jgi:UDP-glucose 6-dehydrogenase